MSRNLAASIRVRLKQRADATTQDFNLTLIGCIPPAEAEATYYRQLSHQATAVVP